MSARKRILLLILTMTICSLIVVAITISFLYQTAIREEEERLVETAQSQARLIESVARFDAIHRAPSVPGSARAATLSQITEAHTRYEHAGRTAEFTLGERQGDSIVFLLRHRHENRQEVQPVNFDSKLAEPMRQALLGRSGSMIGLDYRGETVIAAHEPVSELGLGIVAKIDLSEIRAPFEKSGVLALLFTLFVVAIGSTLFVQITNPIIKTLEVQNRDLEEINEKLKQELKINDALSDLYRLFIAPSADVDNTGQAVLDKAKSLTHSEHGFVCINEPVSGDNVGHTFSGLQLDQCNVNIEERVVSPQGKEECHRGLWGCCLSSQEPCFTNSPEKHFAHVGVPQGHLSIKRLLSVPVLSGEKLVGQIALANKGEDYTQDDVEAIKRMAAFYALAVQRIRAEGALEDLKDALERRVGERTEELKISTTKLEKEVEEHKRTSEKLRESKEMLQSVVDGISDPLILLDSNLVLKMLNSAAIKYYGLSEDHEMLNMKCHQLLRGNASYCKGCGVPEAILTGENEVFERRGFFENDRLENVFVYPIRIGDGEGKNVLLRISDITEERLFEKRLIQNEKMASLGILVSSIAHEINNPNNFISFNIPILKEYVNEMLPIVDGYSREHPGYEICNMPYSDFRKDIVKLLGNIEHGSDRITAFVSNLRNFSQINDKVKEEWIDLNVVINNAVSLCRAQLIGSVRTFVTNVPEDLPQIWSDPYALEQIVINLLVNASQASEATDSRVELSVEVHSSWLNHTILEVRDNGCGMDEKTVQKIFDPFFTTKSREQGTGLGLYVAYSLVESLRGRIEVESELTKGSIFRVILPDKERRSKKRP